MALFVAAGFGSWANAQTQNYFGTSGTLSGSVWSTTPGGPYTSAFDTTGGGIMNFGNAATFTGASITVAGINATANATATAIGGTIQNFGGGVISINVDSGVTLDFSTQGFTTAATAGYTKDGGGVLALAGGTYGGGFTLNSGTVIARGVNAMGGNATPGGLIINGGAIGANGTRDFSGKYSGITVGGNFQLGVAASAVSISSDTANLTFNANMSLGAATRTITVGANGNYTLGGIISGASGTGLTINRLSGATGTLTLNGLNTYDGKTTINGATVSFNSDSSFGAVPGSTVADQLTLDGATLAPSANINFSANRGITLGANGATIRGASGSALQTFNNAITGSGGLTVALGAVDFKTANNFAGDLNLAPTTGAVVARFNADNSAGNGTINVTPSASGGNVTLRNVGGISTTLNNNIVINQNNGKVIAVVSDTNGTFTLNGQLSGVGTLTRGLQGPGGEVVLAGDNSGWSGGLIAQRGLTTLKNKNALGTGTLTISPDTTAGFDAVGLRAGVDLVGANAVANPIALAIPTGAAIPSLTISGTHALELSGAVTISQTSATIINNNTAATILSGNIGDGGANLGLTFQGTGTLTLRGNNTYGGPTTINGTTLVVNNTAGSGTGSGNVTVNLGGTLKGSGNINGTVAVKGTLAPGNSPGQLTTGSETWDGGAKFEFEINDATGTAGVNFDLVKINGDLGINATSGDKFDISVISLALDNNPGFAANFDNTQSYSWTFAQVTGTITGFDPDAFNIITSGFLNDPAGGFWSITEIPDGTGSDLQLTFTPVPEPSVMALVGLGAVSLFVQRAKRKAQI